MRAFITRLRTRRQDKLKLWITLLIGAAMPFVVCLAVPNFLATQRTERAEAEGTATAAAFTVMETTRPELFALCEAPIPDAPSAAVPANPRVLLVQYGGVSAFQAALPAEWQPQDVQAISVLICLSRETADFSEICPDGSVPDLEAFGEDADLRRFQVEAAAYDAQTGDLIAQGVIYGGDPSVCDTPTGELVGAAVTQEAMQAWLEDVLR